MSIPPITIEQMQQAIRDKGWQFLERVFNDGNPHDCFIRLTDDTDSQAFEKSVMGKKAWGRYQRYSCWRMAYEAIVLGLKTD